MTTAEQLAIAVLKGDKDAIRALHDCLAEDFAPNGEAKELVPVTRKITVPFDRLRVVVYFKPYSPVVYRDEVENDVQRWLIRGLALTRPEIDRVEIYELPENFLPKIETGPPPTEEQLMEIRRVLQGDPIDNTLSRMMMYANDELTHNGLTPEQFKAMVEDQDH